MGNSWRLKVAAVALGAAALLDTAAFARPAMEGGPAPAPLPEMLAGSGLLVVNADQGRELRRATIAQAKVENRCTLILRMQDDNQPETVALGDLRFVQGDGAERVDILANARSDRELIVAVGRAKYEPVMRLLSSLATSCGAVLTGPPPLIVTQRP